MTKAQMLSVNKQYGEEVYFNLDQVSATVNPDALATQQREDSVSLIQ
jgi:hypothetical protein